MHVRLGLEHQRVDLVARLQASSMQMRSVERSWSVRSQMLEALRGRMGRASIVPAAGEYSLNTRCSIALGVVT